MNRLGILGGTFDPIHYGHLFMAESAKSRFSLDKVLFIPTGASPHKLQQHSTNKKHRYEMTKLAIADNIDFDISDMEIVREGTSYTIDTVRELLKGFPDTKLYYIMGADSLHDVTGWKDSEELLSMIDIIAVSRKMGHVLDIVEFSKKIEMQYNAKIHTLEIPLFEISSTDIRRKVLNGESVRYMLPDQVIKYIYENKLFNE